MSKYELIIFDCDGTLVDTEEVINRECGITLNNMGYKKYTPKYCMENFFAISPKAVIEILMKEIGDKFDYKRFISEAGTLSRRLIEDEVSAVPHAIETLENLKNFNKCVASNGNRSYVTKSLEVSRLKPYFPDEKIFTHELVKYGKPKPDIFLYAADSIGVSQNRCIVIEDSIVGITAAKAANMDVIAYVHTSKQFLSEIESLKPNAIITDFRDIQKLII